MKLSGKSSKNIEHRGASTKASPFAAAAAETATRTMMREGAAKKTPFNAAMEKAARSDKLATHTREQDMYRRMGEEVGFPAPKQGRPTKFDAKKAKGLN